MLASSHLPFGRMRVTILSPSLKIALPGGAIEPEEARRLFTAFREFAQGVQALSQSQVAMHAVHEDSAILLAALLAWCAAQAWGYS